jgi:hypothetical protein
MITAGRYGDAIADGPALHTKEIDHEQKKDNE